MSEPSLNTPQTIVPSPPACVGSVWACVQDALRGLKYGQVTLIVQDGHVVQVDRLERKRLTKGMQ
jgi:hypothetical protein